MSATILPIGATTFSANHQTHQLDFNLVANLTRPGAPVRGYVIGGPGAYYRKVEITQYIGSGIICDPYWYVCGVYPVSDVRRIARWLGLWFQRRRRRWVLDW